MGNNKFQERFPKSLKIPHVDCTAHHCPALPISNELGECVKKIIYLKILLVGTYLKPFLIPGHGNVLPGSKSNASCDVLFKVHYFWAAIWCHLWTSKSTFPRKPSENKISIYHLLINLCTYITYIKLIAGETAYINML